MYLVLFIYFLLVRELFLQCPQNARVTVVVGISDVAMTTVRRPLHHPDVGVNQQFLEQTRWLLKFGLLTTNYREGTSRVELYSHALFFFFFFLFSFFFLDSLCTVSLLP